VNKDVDHLPFYRQEKRFERIGKLNWIEQGLRSRTLDPETFRTLRKEQTQQIHPSSRGWREKSGSGGPPETMIVKAVSYTLILRI